MPFKRAEPIGLYLAVASSPPELALAPEDENMAVLRILLEHRLRAAREKITVKRLARSGVKSAPTAIQRSGYSHLDLGKFVHNRPYINLSFMP
jgi:hypothetical protein